VERAEIKIIDMGKIRIMNQVRIKMKRRKLSTRLFQMVIVTIVMTLFLYLIFQASLLSSPSPSPDFSWLNTRNLSVYVRPQEQTALIEPRPSPCKSVSESPVIRLLVAVFSAPRNKEARSVIRKTWGKKFQEYPGVKMIFMLGRSPDSDLHKSLMLEAEDHNDVVLEDFHDTYLNLTLKTTFLLKWVGKDCPAAKFVFKVDDDVFVNTEKMWVTLDSSHLFSSMVSVPDKNGIATPSNIDYALIGHVMNTVPIRDPTSKWYLPPNFYPLNIFPKFLSGTGYVFTGSLVPALYSCSLKTPFINLEDVFLTGLCATTQLGLRLTHNEDFVWRPMAIGGSHTCYFKHSVTVHGSSPEHMEEVFARTQDNHLCDTVLFSFMTACSKFVEFIRNIFRI